MPPFSKEVQRLHMERIREILIFNPRATLVTIQKTLEESPKDPRHFHLSYINKLKHRIDAERANRYNRINARHEVSMYEDLIKSITMQLVRIATDKTATHKDKVAAWREIRKSHEDLLQKKGDFGILEKTLGTLNVDEVQSITMIIKEVNKGEDTKTFPWQKQRKEARIREAEIVEGPKPADLIQEENEGTKQTGVEGSDGKHSEGEKELP